MFVFEADPAVNERYSALELVHITDIAPEYLDVPLPVIVRDAQGGTYSGRQTDRQILDATVERYGEDALLVGEHLWKRDGRQGARVGLFVTFEAYKDGLSDEELYDLYGETRTPTA